MIRALYVDIDLVHLNPTATYFPQLIEEAVPGLSFYGPGFSSPDLLEKGLLNWIRETGPYENDHHRTQFARIGQRYR